MEFGDGTRITIDYPSYVMKGVVYSSRPRAGRSIGHVGIGVRIQVSVAVVVVQSSEHDQGA